MKEGKPQLSKYKQKDLESREAKLAKLETKQAEDIKFQEAKLTSWKDMWGPLYGKGKGSGDYTKDYSIDTRYEIPVASDRVFFAGDMFDIRSFQKTPVDNLRFKRQTTRVLGKQVDIDVRASSIEGMKE